MSVRLVSGVGGPGRSAFTTIAWASSIALPDNSSIRISITGNTTLTLPSAASDGDLIFVWASNTTGSSYTVTHSAVIPTTSTATGTVTVAAGKKLCLAFQYDAVKVQWELHQNINGY